MDVTPRVTEGGPNIPRRSVADDQEELKVVRMAFGAQLYIQDLSWE